jgi:hypothetical protein
MFQASRTAEKGKSQTANRNSTLAKIFLAASFLLVFVTVIIVVVFMVARNV